MRERGQAVWVMLVPTPSPQKVQTKLSNFFPGRSSMQWDKDYDHGTADTTDIKKEYLSDYPLRECIHSSPCIPAPKVTAFIGLIPGWLGIKKTKSSGNARKCQARSSTSNRVVLIRLINEVTIKCQYRKKLEN